MTTTYIPKADDRDRKWFVIDAKDQVLGKLAATAASILTGKTKPIYTPFLDTGDHVIVINAEKIKLTGAKEEQKIYRRHSGYPGGLSEIQAKKVRATRPIRMVEQAIAGMLPKTKMGKQMYRKLNVYAGDKHPHQAQKPVELAL